MKKKCSNCLKRDVCFQKQNVDYLTTALISMVIPAGGGMVCKLDDFRSNYGIYVAITCDKYIIDREADDY